jgi:ElaB/YqjD/DUF883 family membrane-anchored ribosome-binding protein
MATNGAEKAEQAVQEARQDLAELRREAYQKAEEVRKEAARQLNTVAETIRREVRDNKADNEAIKRADEVAARLEKTAHYLNTHTVDQMGEEATRIVTRNPWRAVVVALIIGLILGWITRK